MPPPDTLSAELRSPLHVPSTPAATDVSPPATTVPPASSPPRESPAATGWTAGQRFAFRVSALYLLLYILPLNPAWWQRLPQLSTLGEFFGWANLQNARYSLFTLETESGRWGIGSFAPWAAALGLAFAGAGVWTWFARRSPRTEYRTAYYWLRLLVRYWVAMNIMNYGFMKLYPNQMPPPTLANLATNFGDYTTYKLYWQSVGLSTWYQVFLGFVEVAAGALLFFRRTVAIGAAINLGVLAYVAHANLAYDGGVHLHSAAIALFSGFLFASYVPDLWRLFVRRQPVAPVAYRPAFASAWARRTFLGARIALPLFFVGVYAIVRFDAHLNSNFRKQPRNPALAGAAGVYDVTSFAVDGRELPYSAHDAVRWHEAIFEKHGTFVVKFNRAFPIHLSNGAPALRDVQKRYELAGVAGGLRYYYYTVDEQASTLVLQNKNDDADAIAGRRRDRGGNRRDAPEPTTPKYTWQFARPTSDRVELSGTDEDGRPFRAVLVRRAGTFPIVEGGADASVPSAPTLAHSALL